MSPDQRDTHVLGRVLSPRSMTGIPALPFIGPIGVGCRRIADMGTRVTRTDTDSVLLALVFHGHGKWTRIQLREHGSRTEVLRAGGSGHQIQRIVWLHLDDVVLLDFGLSLVVLNGNTSDGASRPDLTSSRIARMQALRPPRQETPIYPSKEGLCVLERRRRSLPFDTIERTPHYESPGNPKHVPARVAVCTRNGLQFRLRNFSGASFHIVNGQPSVESVGGT